VWVNDGSGVFSDSGQIGGAETSRDVGLGDVDGDGDLDAFIVGGQPSKVWLNSAGPVNGEDVNPPNLVDLTQSPNAGNMRPEAEVKVSITVTDDASGVKEVTLIYTNGNGTSISVDMTNPNGDTWSATIPPFPVGTNINYEIKAEDNANNIITTQNESYQVIGASTQDSGIDSTTLYAILIAVGVIVFFLIFFLLRKKKKKKQK
ncbi:hypothetical protein MUO98_03355, partial [Candidatus Bathyarchaeota archaeon]|nr:hypothetical protein [Candidatus Bathyarchaeota archaeon]